MRTLTAYNEDNFRQIEQYKGISVVRFSAPWCPPCQASEEMFSQFADRLDGDIQVGESQCRSGAGADNQIRDLGAAVCADIS
ncbi:Thioredoxin [Escherichia coli]|nr:Thioredoxin [Escherichia coli]